MSKFKYANVGSVSTGTMRLEDLIPCFISELRSLGHVSKELAMIERRIKDTNSDFSGERIQAYYDSDEASYDLNESLFNMLNEHALPYMYFGSHPGDGADYGFWVSEFLEDDFEGLKVNDTGDVPNDYSGEVLHVNDHGNLTLYTAKRGKLKEVWAVV